MPHVQSSPCLYSAVTQNMYSKLQKARMKVWSINARCIKAYVVSTRYGIHTTCMCLHACTLTALSVLVQVWLQLIEVVLIYNVTENITLPKSTEARKKKTKRDVGMARQKGQKQGRKK